MTIPKPVGPYAEEMLEGGGWPEVDETALSDRGDQLVQHLGAGPSPLGVRPAHTGWGSHMAATTAPDGTGMCPLIFVTDPAIRRGADPTGADSAPDPAHFPAFTGLPMGGPVDAKFSIYRRTGVRPGPRLRNSDLGHVGPRNFRRGVQEGSPMAGVVVVGEDTGPWPQPGTPSGPPRGNRRWLLLALAAAVIVAVTVACTVWLTQKGSGNQGGSGGGGSQASNTPTGQIASAGDTGPVGIITEEPTCERLLAMQAQAATPMADWDKRDATIPASAWTPQQRQMYDTAARIFRAQADQLAPLVRDTPHRVIREVYEQIIAYDRAYADAIPHYTPADDNLAVVRNALSAAQFYVCQAIANYAAVNRGPSVPAAEPPTALAPVGDPSNPQRFLTAQSDACPKLNELLDRQELELAQWEKTDPNVPASQRSATDSMLWDSAAKVFGRGADELEQIARSSGNPVMEDFLVLSAQYYRAYVAAIPTYISSDNQLHEVATWSRVSVYNACKTVQG